MPEFGHLGARRLQQLGCVSVGNRATHARAEACFMKSIVSLAWLIAIATVPFSPGALARDAQYDALVATHAKANNLPEALVHRMIVKESGYRPHLVSRG